MIRTVRMNQSMHSAFAQKLRRLERFGIRFRQRRLLFHSIDLDHGSELPQSDCGLLVSRVVMEQFRSYEWRANPWAYAEAISWKQRSEPSAVVAVDSRRLAGYCWLEHGTTELTYFDIAEEMPAGLIYLSRAWVDPEFRGIGAMRAILQRARIEATAAGGSVLFSACVPDNHRMIHLFRSLGWRLRLSVRYFAAGPFRCYSVDESAGRQSRVYSERAGALTIFRAMSFDNSGSRIAM
jgi:GNAT superfamily N-acetyltransferase